MNNTEITRLVSFLNAFRILNTSPSLIKYHLKSKFVDQYSIFTNCDVLYYMNLQS